MTTKETVSVLLVICMIPAYLLLCFTIDMICSHFGWGDDDGGPIGPVG